MSQAGWRRGRDARALDEFESRLVWIFGSPRTGSTWLLQLLTHPLAVADDSELGVTRREAPDAGDAQVVPIDEPYIPQHLAPALPDELVVSDALPAVTIQSLRAGSPNYFLSGHYAGVWRAQLRRLVLARLRSQAERIASRYSLARPLVAVKEPNGSLGADFTMSLLPRARLIFLPRGARDVVDSMIDAQAPGRWLGGRAAKARLSSVTGDSRSCATRRACGWRGRARSSAPTTHIRLSSACSSATSTPGRTQRRCSPSSIAGSAYAAASGPGRARSAGTTSIPTRPMRRDGGCRSAPRSRGCGGRT